MNEDKRTLRRQMRARRAALGEDEQRRAAEAVAQRLLAMDAFQHARCVMAYAAIRGELSLERVIGDILSSGKALVMPRCETAGEMTARRIERMAQLEPGTYGVPEPGVKTQIVPPQQIDLILVPGTAFDRQMNRIGQGAGYYDRFLARTGALRVGVCHDFALLESVPAQAHDVKMDWIVTPSGLWTACDDEDETEDLT